MTNYQDNWTEYEKSEHQSIIAQMRVLRERKQKLLGARQSRIAEAKRMAELRARREANELAKRKEQAAAQAKKDRDDRIRRAVLAFADSAKANGIKFKAPNWGEPRMVAFRLIVGVEDVQIYTTSSGFQWD